jgi:hypothetical protein
MKHLLMITIYSATISCLVLTSLSPAMSAEPAEDSASRLGDALRQRGWRVEQAPDGSLYFYPEGMRRSDRRQGQPLEDLPWRSKRGPDGSLYFWPSKGRTPFTPPPPDVAPGPQEKPAPRLPVATPAMQRKPAPATAPSRNSEAKSAAGSWESIVGKRMPVPDSGAVSAEPVPEQRYETYRPSRYAGYPRYRRLPTGPFRRPPGTYPGAVPPRPYGPGNCGWRRGGRPDSALWGGRPWNWQGSEGDK